MTWLLSLATGIGIPARFAKPLVYAALIALLVGGLGVAKCAYDHHVIGVHEAKMVQRAKPATDQAATERAHDIVTQAKNEQEAHDAIHSVPDAAPAGPSHQLSCQRLRKRGHAPASCG